jgi:hypothetical protein
MPNCRMADTLERPEERNMRIEVGGPDVLSFRQIALLAAQAAGVKNLRCRNLFGHARQCRNLSDHARQHNLHLV